MFGPAGYGAHPVPPERKRKKPHPKDKEFSELLKRAEEAANLAGDEWFKKHTKPAIAVMDGNKVVGTMLDVCGFAYIEVRDRRIAFYKWGKDKHDWNYGYIGLNYKYSFRQELGLKEACLRAALEVLLTAGIKGLWVSARID